jgi:hypothetical protein
MQSENVSEDIKHLTYIFITIMIEKCGNDVKVPARFVDIYAEACKVPSYGNTKYDKSNLQLRQSVRDNLLRNGYIFVDPKDVDSIFLTQKAIQEYADY